MTDTAPGVDVRMRELFARRSGADRVRMACEMFDLARALVVSGIRADHPGIGDTELRAKVFERMYADDFAPDERARITARLRRRPGRASR